jgi:hypothetical protein
MARSFHPGIRFRPGAARTTGERGPNPKKNRRKRARSAWWYHDGADVRRGINILLIAVPAVQLRQLVDQPEPLVQARLCRRRDGTRKVDVAEIKFPVPHVPLLGRLLGDDDSLARHYGPVPRPPSKQNRHQRCLRGSKSINSGKMRQPVVAKNGSIGNGSQRGENDKDKLLEIAMTQVQIS